LESKFWPTSASKERRIHGKQTKRTSERDIGAPLALLSKFNAQIRGERTVKMSQKGPGAEGSESANVLHRRRNPVSKCYIHSMGMATNNLHRGETAAISFKEKTSRNE
jgi:hypothetical protein